MEGSEERRLRREEMCFTLIMWGVYLGFAGFTLLVIGHALMKG